MVRIFRESHIDFVSIRRYSLPVAALLVLASVALFVFRGHQYGVDFVGGSLVQVRFLGARSGSVSTEAVRDALTGLGAEGASIQRFGESDEFLIRTEKVQSYGGRKFSDEVLYELSRAFKCDSATRAANPGAALVDSVVKRMDTTIAPRMGRELQQKALLAVLLGLFGILLYVSFRFDLRFGICGVLALIVDVTITLGVFSALGKEITIPIVAAFLTIIGYDINDKIVVSDRIREDVKKFRKERFADIVNRALNETLSRTFLTGFSVLMVLLCLLFLGAAAIKDFALTMAVGLLVGTFSSILVMPQLVVEWETRLPARRF
jgi:preprotein translocase subunit SecF